MEFFRQEYWSGLPFPSPGDPSDPGTEPGSPTLQADSVPSEPPGKMMIKGLVVQLPSCVQLFAAPWTAACQASLALTVSRSSPKFMSIALVMLSSHLIL